MPSSRSYQSNFHGHRSTSAYQFAPPYLQQRVSPRPPHVQILSRSPKPPQVDSYSETQDGGVNLDTYFETVQSLDPDNNFPVRRLSSAMQSNRHFEDDFTESYIHDSVLQDGELPRAATLEDYVKFKPARQRKGASPKRQRQRPDAAISKESANTTTKPEQSQPAQQTDSAPQITPNMNTSNSRGRLEDDLFNHPEDPQNADGDFRYRDLATGEVMVFQWQVLVMDWVHMGTIERHNVEAFRAFKEGCLHDSTYRLPNNQFDKGKFREHMNLAISQMRGGSSPNKQGGTPVPPAAPPSTPASGPAHDDFVHPQRKKLFQPPPVFKPQRRPPGESPTAQLRHQLQQQHTSQGIPTGPRSGSAGYRPPQSASISQADPFVSNDPVHSASQNPSASWLREQHHWQEQENRRIALINAHQQRYEVQRQEAQRDFDIQRLNQAAVAANNQAPSPVPPNYPNNLQQQSTTTPTRPIPHREELRRTVLHDPYRNSNTPHPASSSNTTTPIGKPSTTPYNAQRTMGDAQSQQGHHYWNSQRTAGTTHTARDPWSPSASSFPGNRNPLPPSLHPNITSDFDDLGSPHLPDDDLRDFYKPVDFNARPLTAPDAMRPNTAAPVVIKPIATPQSVASESRSRPDTAPGTNPKAESGNGNGSLNINDTIQTVEKAVAEAAEQEAHLLQIAVDERSYNEKLDAWWTSGLSHLPGLHMGVAGRVLHAKQAGRKDVESAAFLMGLLHFRFQEYEDDQTFRAGYQHNFGDVSANNRWLDSHARFARRFPSRFVAPEPGTCVDGGESGYVDSLFLAQGPTLPRSEPQQATSERPMRHEQVQGYEHSNKVDGGMRAVEEFPVLKAAMDARLMQDAQALGGLERESEADGQRARVVLPGARVPRCARGLGGRVGEVGGSGAVKDSRWNPRPEGW